jgi:hypothetical protein
MNGAYDSLHAARADFATAGMQRAILHTNVVPLYALLLSPNRDIILFQMNYSMLKSFRLLPTDSVLALIFEFNR